MSAKQSARSEQPAYKVLARTLRRQILADDFQDGEALPSDNELAADHHLSRQTVRRAYLDLVAEGLVYRVTGTGTFVTPKSERYRRYFSSVEELLDTVLDAEFEVISPLTSMYDEEIAQQLRLTTRSMLGITIRRHRDEQPFCVTEVFLPATFAEILFADPGLSTVGYRTSTSLVVMLETKGHRVTGEDQVATATLASKEYAEPLACQAGDALMRIDRIYYRDESVPMLVTRSHYRGDLYQHRIRLGRGPRGLS